MADTLPWHSHRRITEPPAKKVVVFKSQGLGLLTQQFASTRRPNILDLGSVNGSNVTYFSQWPCMLHIEDLLWTLAENARVPAPEGQSNIENAIMYGHGTCFDAVLGWDLFDYLDIPTITAITHRIRHYCRPKTPLLIMSSNREVIPDKPGRFTILDEQRLRFERTGASNRDGSKYSPRALERILPGFRLQHSFLLGDGMQEYLFSCVEPGLKPHGALTATDSRGGACPAHREPPRSSARDRDRSDPASRRRADPM